MCRRGRCSVSCASCVCRPSGAARSWRQCRYSAGNSSRGRIHRDSFPVPVRETHRPAARHPVKLPVGASILESHGRRTACASAHTPRPGAAAARPPGSRGTRKAASAGAHRRWTCRSLPLPCAAVRPSRPPAEKNSAAVRYSPVRSYQLPSRLQASVCALCGRRANFRRRSCRSIW